jgi:hypothetical protein
MTVLAEIAGATAQLQRFAIILPPANYFQTANP